MSSCMSNLLPHQTRQLHIRIHYLAELQGVHAHDIRVRAVSGKLEVDFDVEVHADMDLGHAHAVATRLQQSAEGLSDVIE